MVITITGCLGFIGAHLTRACLERGWYVVGVDRITYVSGPIPSHPRFKFVQLDINDLDRLRDCDWLINTAAETHVDNSIACSDNFVRSNINGVHHLLKLARCPILHFSTDEVYGDSGIGRPSNPYAATKAAADMLIFAWARTYGLPYMIVRPTNNYGIGQYVDKLIPKTVQYALLGRPMPLHQRGTPLRTWLHVSDTVAAVLTLLERGQMNEVYDIGGNFETSNLDVVQRIHRLIPGTVDLDYNRPGQDVRYVVDDSKLRSLGWAPRADFDTELARVVEHYSTTFMF
jgi:dTDP-glucose 4,6-dehydratase